VAEHQLDAGRLGGHLAQHRVEGLAADVVAAEVAGIEPGPGFDALDEALEADVVRPTHAPRQFRFRHPLVRRAVYESLGPGWRLAAHGRAAAALARRGAPPAMRARHVECSAELGDDEAVAVLADAAARELRRLGRRVRRPGGRAPGATGVAALSAREREIAELVAEGKTNQEIGSALHLSPKTVEGHLSRIFGKLRVSSRAKLAAEVERSRAARA
jgi:DNA-binding CsgD family transcriptional regulator